MLWGWVAFLDFNPYVLKTWCQKSPPYIYKICSFCLTRTHPFSLCPVLTWRMLQVQTVRIESNNCQSWEMEGFWYLSKMPCCPHHLYFSPVCLPTSSSNLTWFGLVSWPSLTFRSKNLVIGSETVPGIQSLCCDSQNSCESCKTT